MHKSPITTVRRVISVITHHKILIRRHSDFKLGARDVTSAVNFVNNRIKVFLVFGYRMSRAFVDGILDKILWGFFPIDGQNFMVVRNNISRYSNNAFNKIIFGIGWPTKDHNISSFGGRNIDYFFIPNW